MRISVKLSQFVRDRAAQRCEYCHLPEIEDSVSFHLDHIIPKKHGGPTTAQNLALSCSTCNRFKLDNVAGFEPDGGTLVRLFNPRNDQWNTHFDWNGAVLIGRTEIGKATILVLNINHSWRFEQRSLLLRLSRFPQP